ncbi:Beta-galactosidase [Seminavis robusta]|uniref:Beta-galactosidase n=1 Tax=Seminavis robusta TaxID=568900 RepID=A0A9N8EIU5_9STRA|nr:Beta-galactosidase [Seminavis robusta]|eukprot:Sro1059_g236500.1 Beta-galactosidase (669) ;mRNA; f:11176-13182
MTMTSLLLISLLVASLQVSTAVNITTTRRNSTIFAPVVQDFGPDQPRYWPQYGGKRVVKLLDGTWEMGQLGSIDHPPPADYDSMDPNFDPSKAETPNSTEIPSCIDNTPPGYLGYRGITYFRTHFDYDLTASPARLVFQACSFYCRVFVNGQEVGDHRAGGYVAFALDIPKQPANSTNGTTNHNELFVLVDNRFNKTTAPTHERGDYWHYSGIMRSVELHTIDESQVWPWRVYVLPTSLKTVDITVHLTDPTYSGKITGGFAFDKVKGNPFVRFHAKAENGILTVPIHHVPGPRLWSISNPNLHTIGIKINGGIVTERFGLRQFGVDKATSRITVNGEIVKLVGWNHHTQWPETAASPTEKDMDNDMALLLQAGTNYVRGAHYPQDPRWLDRLDEAGVIMWCETLGAGVKKEDTVDPYFMKYQTQQLHEMMDNALNHASIMLWAFFNEGPSDHADACVGYETCVKVIKERDPTRLVTWASNKLQNDKCLHAADVVSFNNYPAWYGRPNVDPVAFWNHHADHVKAGAYNGTLGKPFLISETGAGGIYEWSDNKTAAKWTLAYQSKIIGKDVDVAIANQNISGVTLWHFFDFKTFDNTENNTHCDYVPDKYPPICAFINVSSYRPGGLNHKGVIDFWRRKKPIYDIVAGKYNATRKFLNYTTTDVDVSTS